MTTTTKLFVILVCLFAFIFTPMAIQFAARANDWRAMAEGLRDAAETAMAHERSAMAIAASEIEHYKALRDEQRAKAEDLQQRLDQLLDEIDTLTAQNAELARARDGLRNATELQAAQNTILVSHNDNLSKAKDSLTVSETDLQTRNNLLSSRIQELTANAILMGQQLTKLEQTAAVCRQENERWRQELGVGLSGERVVVTPTPKAQGTTPVTGSPIRGKVTKIRDGLIGVDVGSASGVQENTVLVVTRGDEYICDVQIGSEVSPNEAVGEVTLAGAGGVRVRVGDQVEDLASFNSR